MQRNKRLSLLIAVMMVVSVFCAVPLQATAASQLKDIDGHWAQVQIQSMSDKGIITGYPDNAFKPNNTITRAEFITLTNRAFSYKETAQINYTDVSVSDWFAPEIAKAKAAGYIAGYEDGTMKPNAEISRQEVAKILAVILKLNISNGVIDYFNDSASIPAWSKEYIAAMTKGAYMNGYPDGTFKPTKSLTRAEAAVIMNRSLDVQNFTQTVFDKAGTYGPEIGTRTIKDNLTIKADGVTLQNLMIDGDLVIDAAVGNGTVTLKNVTVTGNTIIKGAAKVVLDHSVLNLCTVNNPKNKVDLQLINDSKIVKLVLDSAANVTGAGVGEALINAKDVTLQVAPAKVSVKSGLSANVGGKTVYGSGGSSGGSSSGGVTVTAPVLSNVTIGDGTNTINPKVAGTTFTFSVKPSAAYTTGTAKLDVNASYTIESGAYKVTGTATTSDDILKIALAALKAKGGTNEDVLGSTLIANTGVKITLAATADPSKTTVYTINFIPATAPTLADVTVGGISPTVAGTTLTFSVNPATAYKTGTATLSENAIYTIVSGAYNVPGTAKTSDNLLTTALSVLAAKGGTNEDVLGSTLIANSPVTLTLKAEADPTLQTIYTINFTPIVAPTLSNVTVGGITPVISGTTLTFGVSPTTAYTTGTATLSGNASYVIDSKNHHNVTGTAKTSDNLVDIALALLAANSGSGNDVSGATLIAESPITITLTAANDVTKTTTYTINFVGAPTLSNVTLGGITPVINGNTLTFGVIPTVAYNTGTATLSADASYTIASSNNAYTANGDATAGANIASQVLAVFALAGGQNGDVLGSTLIANSSVTVTLTSASGSTVYTFIFAAPVKPAAPAVTNDDTANTVAGMAAGMEYKLDAADYVAYVKATFDAIDFSGNHTLLVRVAAEGINPASDAVTLNFTTNPVTPEAPNVTADDTNNVITGIDATMEYKIDEGAWTPYVAASPPNLAGDHTVLVRVAASGINPAGATTSLTFTTNVVSVVVSALGAEGDLTTADPNVYYIEAPLGGLRSFGIRVDRLPAAFAGATGYKLVIDSTEYTLAANMFNAKIYQYDFPDTITADQIKGGSLRAIF